MSLVTYDTPILIGANTGNERPKPLANRSFPYNSLDDRNFEELLYNIYHYKLNTVAFPHGKISLMSGVRHQSLDCPLI
jgi:hypothetical protein